MSDRRFGSSRCLWTSTKHFGSSDKHDLDIPLVPCVNNFGTIISVGYEEVFFFQSVFLASSSQILG